MAKHDFSVFNQDKNRGELAELAFMYRATSEGITVAKPWGDSHPYDCLVQFKSRLLRVQVKSTFRGPHGKYLNGYRVIVARRMRKKCIYYTPEEVDFLVAFLAPCDTWYIIPIQDLPRHRTIWLYPNGTRIKLGGLFEKFREAWYLLRGEGPPADPAAKIAEISAFCPELLELRVNELT